ncbi:MAG: quinone oxidoreductase [Rhodospirillales bacterium CG15_BIG_FIL_POST_REV_8_21_14_020_66_15]|nr:MAG: quinone oxidoreductase [Rhodospirillales bacterium CG15_BIG_FIL_POST_REV_8_21_14_020_66_15]
MVKAAVIHEKGGPEVFRFEDVEVGEPGPGEVRLRHTAIGVNFADTYHRGGVSHPWAVDRLPCVLGFEAVGVVTRLGAGVTGFAVGDKAVYGLPPLGAYAEERLYPAASLLRVPAALGAAGIGDTDLAGVFMRGLTAYYLLHKTCAVGPGDWILIHAAAGGMGHLLVPWAKHLGANVVATAGSPEKLRIVTELGADRVVGYRDDFAKVCREATGGKGVRVVYESIGKDTIERSLDSLANMGVCAVYGHASGPIPPVDIIRDLGARGSLFITRPAVMHYMAEREALEEAAAGLFAALEKGVVASNVTRTYPLSQAAEAHRALEGRETTGSTVLLP